MSMRGYISEGRSFRGIIPSAAERNGW